MTAVDPANPPAAEQRPQTAAGCLVALMRSIEVIRKERESGAGERYMFRGVDDVMNAVGPLLRDLGLLCVPELVAQETEQMEYGGKRTLAFRTRVQVRYHLIGPDGAPLQTGPVGPVLGEAIDTADKGGAKAQAVAYREMWLRTLCIPTGEREVEQDNYVIARPEATVSDPLAEQKLRDRIAAADTRAKLETAWKAIYDAHGGEKAQITSETRDDLLRLCRIRAVELGLGDQQNGGTQGEASR